MKDVQGNANVLDQKQKSLADRLAEEKKKSERLLCTIEDARSKISYNEKILANKIKENNKLKAELTEIQNKHNQLRNSLLGIEHLVKVGLNQ